MIDPDSRAAERLGAELIAWLTTVTAGGTPQTSPVWFLWDGADFLVYSLPSARTRNIAANPSVSLNLDGDGMGGDIVTIEGRARIDTEAPNAAEVPEYLAKYRERMDSHGWSAAQFAADYPVPIRITPTRIRSW